MSRAILHTCTQSPERVYVRHPACATIHDKSCSTVLHVSRHPACALNFVVATEQANRVEEVTGVPAWKLAVAGKVVKGAIVVACLL